MARKKAEAAPVEKAEKAKKPAKEKAPPKERKILGMDPTTKIVMLTDKDGKAYGVNNNPKRPGTKASEWFSKHRNGMTLKALVDAGVPTGDIKWNIEHKFIAFAA